MQRLFQILAAATGWFALGLQYYVVVHDKSGHKFIEGTLDFFSFFTILSNILVALALTLPWLGSDWRLGRFFARPSVRTAIAAYIIVVAAIYHLVLRPLWNPQGLQLAADILLHSVMPSLYIADWLLFVPKGTLTAKHVLSWQTLPVAYAAYALMYGSLSGFYLYPFFNVPKLGYQQVLTNIAALYVVFIALGFVLMGLDRFSGRVLARLRDGGGRRA
jgi:hypothetical protein